MPRLVDADGHTIIDEDGYPINGHVILRHCMMMTVVFQQMLIVFVPEPARGDWGGIDIRNDIDQDREMDFFRRMKGYFLIISVRLRFSTVVAVYWLMALSKTVGPISLRDARPTISNNVIMHSAQAAITATPDSFEETNFNASLYQATPFTIDYDRVGPAIHGNTVSENSINGLFVSVATPAGDELEELTQSSRWDDNDIVHVLLKTW